MKQSKFIKGKTRDERFAYLNSLQYSILLKQKKDKFYLIIPELSLIAINNNLEEGYQDLRKQKQDLITKILDCEAEDEITLPRKTKESHETFHQLKVFTYKLLIICALVGMTFTISGALLVSKISHSGTTIVSIFKQPIKSIIDQLETSLFKTPEDLKQKRLKKLHQFIEALRPYSHELQTLFSPHVNEEGMQVNE